jgi:uncharacterized short protein YbdD (DUF466 family)
VPGRLDALARAVRTIIGVPDYERYLRYMSQRHAAEQPLPREQFLRLRLQDRYNRPGSRCC